LSNERFFFNHRELAFVPSSVGEEGGWGGGKKAGGGNLYLSGFMREGGQTREQLLKNIEIVKEKGGGTGRGKSHRSSRQWLLLEGGWTRGRFVKEGGGGEEGGEKGGHGLQGS